MERQRVKGQAHCRLLLVFWLLPCAFCVARAAAAQPAPPQLTAPVNDFAHVIDADSAREIDRRVRALQAKTGDAVVVATVPTYKPYADINEYAVKMFENGGKGIGGRSKDNGALIVAAIDDRQVRIEVGYGLEEYITDGYAGETIRGTILPAFRNGQYGPGLLAGVTRIINRIAAARGVTLTDVPAERPPGPALTGFPVWLVVMIGWMILLAIVNSINRRRFGRQRFWGGGPWSGWNSGVGPFGGGSGGFGGGFGGFGGGGGGGFGGFGGGRSGGGGASGGW